MKPALIALVFAAFATPLAAATPMPAWLAGTWAMERGAQWADEVWLNPRGASMQGLSRSGFGPEVQSWEAIRIVGTPDGSLTLITQPDGGAPVAFPLAFVSAEAIEFANARNDYPQRIRYSRAGQLLTIEVSRIDGSDAVQTNYRPVENRAD